LLIPGSKIPFADYRDLAIDTFRRNLLLFHSDCLPHHIAASSDKFFELWAQKAEVADFFGRTTTLGGPISLAYIDGDHTYEQSLRDFENVDRFLLPGGFIIFDDSADYSSWESKRSAREAASRADYELVAKAPNYCIAKRH
jgi:Methyltransferase domain